MNSRRKFYRGRREFGNDLLECLRRILHPNDCCSDLFGKIGRHNHGGGACFAQLREVTRIVEKRYFMDGRLCQRSCAGDFRFGIALEFSAGQFRDLFQSERHTSLLNCRGACAKRLLDVRHRSESNRLEEGAPKKPATRQSPFVIPSTVEESLNISGEWSAMSRLSSTQGVCDIKLGDAHTRRRQTFLLVHTGRRRINLSAR